MSKPGSTDRIERKLRISRPEPINRTKASDTSLTTSNPRTPVVRGARLISRREDWTAGISPNRMPVRSETSIVNKSRRSPFRPA